MSPSRYSRPWSSCSCLSILLAIWANIAGDPSLTFLVGSRQNVASWDPLVVAFDGLRWRGLPHYLHSTDDEWVHHVREMVLQADAAEYDVSNDILDAPSGDAC